MKTLIEMLIGATVHASAKEIKGKKSHGTEDSGSYKHWRLDRSGTQQSYN